MIGIFDSGLGGLSVLRAIRAQMPAANVSYVADTAHIPYGPRPTSEIRDFSQAITQFLMEQGARVIVIACNTASAAALQYLRATFPAMPFVGMEPAVKPAAEQTQTRVVGVLATPATLQGELFASVVERFAQNVTVLSQVCPGLVERIEAGQTNTPETEAALRGWVEPLLAQHIDTLVLGCTHYPFVRPLLEKICGPQVRIIDPAPAIARQTQRLFEMTNVTDGQGQNIYFTSGEEQLLQARLQQLALPLGKINIARWHTAGGRLCLARDDSLASGA